MLYFFTWGISATTEAPTSLEGPQVWCIQWYHCCKILNDFGTVGPMFPFALGPSNSIVILDGGILEANGL